MGAGVSRFEPSYRPKPPQSVRIRQEQPRWTLNIGAPARDLFRSRTIVSPGQIVSLSDGQPRVKLSALIANVAKPKTSSTGFFATIKARLNAASAAKAATSAIPAASTTALDSRPQLDSAPGGFGLPAEVELPGVGPVNTWALVALGVVVLIFVVRGR